MNTPSNTSVPRYFEPSKLMAMLEIRSTKPEIRKKSEGRSPKGVSSATAAAFPARRTHASPPLGGRHFFRSTPTEIAVRSGATAEGGPARISDFGLLSDFGFRPSDFPHDAIPLKTANNQNTAGFTLLEGLVV